MNSACFKNDNKWYFFFSFIFSVTVLSGLWFSLSSDSILSTVTSIDFKVRDPISHQPVASIYFIFSETFIDIQSYLYLYISQTAKTFTQPKLSCKYKNLPSAICQTSLSWVKLSCNVLVNSISIMLLLMDLLYLKEMTPCSPLCCRDN